MQDFRSRWLVHQNLYYRVAFMILGDSAEAMDVVQEVYLKLWKSRELLREVRSPEAYGARLTRNLCIDLLRRRSLHPPAPLDATLELASAQTSDAKVLADEGMRALERAMSRMSEKQREVVRLKYLEGLDYDEIRQRTGLGAVNIRVLISRARSTIKKAFNDEK